MCTAGPRDCFSRSRRHPGRGARPGWQADPGIAVSDAPDELLDAVVRLLRLLERPRDRRTLAPLVKQEILWRLMTGDQGDAIRQLGLADSSASPTAACATSPGRPSESEKNMHGRSGSRRWHSFRG
jgi:hypothetical protein